MFLTEYTVSGDKVISGYGRVVPKDNWLAITAGSFSIDQIDNWLYYNELCQKFMVEKEKEIVESVQSLNLNHQGVDLVIDEDSKELFSRSSTDIRYRLSRWNGKLYTTFL